MNAFTAKEYTCYYAACSTATSDGGRALVDMLLHSMISATDLAGEADVILSEIEMHEDSPEDMVHDVFTEALWPATRSGDRSWAPRTASRPRSRASVRGFYRRHYVPGRMVSRLPATFGTIGCCAMLAERMEVGRPLGARGRTAKKSGACTERQAVRPSEIKRKRIEQAHIVVGTNGLARTDHDRSRSSS